MIEHAGITEGIKKEIMKKTDRQIIFNKFGGRCGYCGCDLGKGWHVDEVLPIVRGWEYIKDESGQRVYDNKKHDYKKRTTIQFPERLNIDNQMPACASCNILKSSQSLEGFRSSIAQFINSLNSYTNQYKIAKRYGLVEETNKPVIFYFETF